jgi:hypothetical protein
MTEGTWSADSYDYCNEDGEFDQSMQQGMLLGGLEDEDDPEVQKLDMEIAKKELQVLTK